MPRARPFAAVAEMAAGVSRRKQIFRAAASSGVSGGVRRVLTCPARGALVMTARAQSPGGTCVPRLGSRTRCTAFIQPCCFLRTGTASTLFAERVLIAAVLPDLHITPRLTGKQTFEFLSG